MNLPEKIKIGGFDWRIVESQDVANAAEIFGQTHFRQQKIFIEPSETDQKKEQTLIHEIMHALLWQSGLTLRFDKKEIITEEEIVSGLSMGIHQVLKDNNLWKL